jgi:ribosome recycling factor
VVDDILAETEEGMKKAVESFKRDLSKVRTGRANLALLDDVKVEYYGSLTPLNQVATLNVVDARLITVKPWEKNLIPVIEKAVRAASLGINPVADAELVRLPVPPLTQERRKELAKQVGKMAETARVAVRAARRDGNEMLKDAEKEKEISEDEGKRGQKGIQELTDRYVAQVEEIAANKEKEILEI